MAKTIYVVQCAYKDGAWTDNFFIQKQNMEPRKAFIAHVKAQNKSGFKYRLVKRVINETIIIGSTRKRDL